MNTTTRAIAVTGALFALLLSLSLVPVGLADDGETDRIRALESRIQALEHQVSEDRLHPGRTILARIEALEGRMRAVETAVDQAATSWDHRQVGRAVDEVRRQAMSLESRLAVVERDSRRPDPTVDARQLRQEISQLSRRVDDLSMRVRQVETQQRR